MAFWLGGRTDARVPQIGDCLRANQKFPQKITQNHTLVLAGRDWLALKRCEGIRLPLSGRGGGECQRLGLSELLFVVSRCTASFNH